jgi:hypothetical protein
MTPAKRPYFSAPPALESLRVYRDALRSYSDAELEDVYFHIDLLREPVRYRLVQMEMEKRGLRTEPDTIAGNALLIDRLPGFGNSPLVRHVYLTSALFTLTAAVMAAMLVPIWLLSNPCGFRGVQASLVYLALAPVVPGVGLWMGIRAGGWKPRSFAAVGAVVASLAFFYWTGGVDAILQPLFRAGGGAGGLMSGW